MFEMSKGAAPLGKSIANGSVLPALEDSSSRSIVPAPKLYQSVANRVCNPEDGLYDFLSSWLANCTEPASQKPVRSTTYPLDPAFISVVTNRKNDRVLSRPLLAAIEQSLGFAARQCNGVSFLVDRAQQ